MENMGNLRRTDMCGNLRIDDENREVVLMGWVQKRRNLGGLTFVDLRDTTGIAQIVFDEDISEDSFKKAQELRGEFVIAIRGKVKERESKNPDMLTGDIEVFVEEIKILNRSETPPIYIKDNDEVAENMRLKYRYLDLRKPHMQKLLKTRHKITKVIREFLDQNSFIDIETPMLTKPTPEGARDYLVPSRVHPGEFFALPQSPQILKQLLMVAGFDRYYQIVKCFRDEDLRANRQPEFTQVDIEMSFVDMEDIIEINEELISKIFKEVKGIELKRPFNRMSFKEAMERYGSDKPDLRFGFELKDLSDIVEKSEFKVFSGAIENNGAVKAINISGYGDEYSRKKISKLEDTAKTFGAKGLAWIKITSEGINSPIAKFLSEEELNGIIERMEAKEGDLILIVADKKSVVYTTLGNLRIHIANQLDIIDKESFEILWVVDFPLFEYDEDEERYVAKHHPFTHPLDEDLDILDTDSEKARAKAYDIVINGDEIGGGSIRINNTEVQNKMFKALGLDSEEVEEKFGFLLEAFKYGVPPHGGIAYGLDRLVMTLTNTDNMRDIIAFPKTQSATCLLTDAPTTVENAQLEELAIKIDLKEDK
ncbi:MAG: aspartate--tRNA ligase [Andreesenia angusta]|nr:aspartate--tRNA ligase [Andreesenia angusta]